MDVPWAWTRRRIAAKWNIPPWEVDLAPIDEILTEVKLHEIEAETEPKRKR